MRGRGDSSSFVVWNCCQLANNMEQVVGVGVKDGVIVMSIRLGAVLQFPVIYLLIWARKVDSLNLGHRFHIRICLF